MLGGDAEPATAAEAAAIDGDDEGDARGSAAHAEAAGSAPSTQVLEDVSSTKLVPPLES